jgi:ribosomal protein S18 acetylase RimI-like enzyme
MRVESRSELCPGEIVALRETLRVRLMRPDDATAIVAIDEASSGRRRPRYFELLLQRALNQPALQVSLVAEYERRAVGFIVASLYYGEYGLVEPSASIDAIGVTPSLSGHGVGHALMRQLLLNLGALQIEAIRTEVAWDDFDLLAFLRHEGFGPSARISLERRLDPTSDLA